MKDFNSAKSVKKHKNWLNKELMCYEFDLPKPIWLESNKKDFILHDRTRFRQESFIEGVDFDYMDFQVIEDDY